MDAARLLIELLCNHYWHYNGNTLSHWTYQLSLVCKLKQFFWVKNWVMITQHRGVSSGGLRELEHPPKVWHNSHLSSCVTTIVTDKQQLIAKTNKKTYWTHSKRQFLVVTRPKTAFFVIKNALMRGVVNVLGAWIKILHAFGSVSTFLKSWTLP